MENPSPTLLADTNILIALTVPESPVFESMETLLKNGEILSASAVVWFEFVCGPLSASDKDNVRQVLNNQILPLTDVHAEKAAELFNAAGRARQKMRDCMVAGAAIAAGLPLLTQNVADFKSFKAAGLVVRTI